jgi:hypothetical protein
MDIPKLQSEQNLPGIETMIVRVSARGGDGDQSPSNDSRGDIPPHLRVFWEIFFSGFENLIKEAEVSIL